jgi:hypothetical protein
MRLPGLPNGWKYAGLLYGVRQIFGIFPHPDMEQAKDFLQQFPG